MASSFAELGWLTVVLAVITVLIALVLLVVAIWALALYRRGQRRDAAKWMHEMFQRFQLGNEFDRARLVFEFQYQDIIEPIHAALVAGGDSALAFSKSADRQHIDRLLRYLDHLLYLADNGQADWNDCAAYFKNWFDRLSDPERGALRRYLINFGYERLAKFARVFGDELILLYGSLGSREPLHVELGLDKALQRLGAREIQGSLYDLGDYPGLVLGSGVVVAELFKIRDLSVLARLDQFEEYDPTNPAQSLFRRTTLQLPKHRWRIANKLHGNPTIDPWIYVYNRPISGKDKIAGPSWREYKRTSQKPEFPPSAV